MGEIFLGFVMAAIIALAITGGIVLVSDTKIIPDSFSCTKTEMRGESPNRMEYCIQYTDKEVK